MVYKKNTPIVIWGKINDAQDCKQTCKSFILNIRQTCCSQIAILGCSDINNNFIIA